MGRIKRAAADKHGATLPPVLSDFVHQITRVPLYELPKQLDSFPHHWPFPRGDLYHWIPVLDYFDDILAELIGWYNLHDGPQLIPFSRRCLNSRFEGTEQESEAAKILDGLGFGPDGDRRLVASILKFSRMLMDNCGNRSLYNSSERLNILINTTSLPLLLEILRLASRLALRYNFSRVRSAVPNLISHSLLHSHYNINLEHVQKLAEPFSRLSSSGSINGVQDASRKGKEKLAADSQAQPYVLEPNDFVELLRNDVDEKSFAEYTSISFRYYQLSTTEDSEQNGSINGDQSKAPTTPTPVRRSSGLSKQHKLQDGEYLAAHDKASATLTTLVESGQRIITIDSTVVHSQSLEKLLKQYLPQLPKSSHFDFLARLQVAKALVSGPEARLDVVEMRLLALMNIAYIYPERDFQNKLLAYDSDEPRRLQIVNQLAEIIRPVTSGQPKLRMSLKTTAISTLEALSKHKSRFGDVCAALQINVNHGIIFQILNEAIAELAEDKTGQLDEEEEDWRDALLSLLEILPSNVTNARTAETLIGAGFFDMLVKELQLRSEKAERVHYKVLMFVITMNHMVRDALQTFANSKGFDVVSDLLAYEVRTAIEDVKDGKSVPERHRSQIMDYQMSFFKQQTLRWLFKFINSMLSQQGGNVERLIRNLIDSPPLLTALRQVIENANIFGANTWSGAINVLSSFIHNEPTSYAIIVEAGLSKTLLESIAQLPVSTDQSDAAGVSAEACKVLKSGPDTVEVYPQVATNHSTESPIRISLQRSTDKPLAAGILAATEPMLQIPHALGALCLNPSGQDLLLKSNVLDVYLEIFESPAHVKILSKDTSSTRSLGTTFDELTRHHPRLKHTIVRAVVTSIARVSYLCKLLAVTKDEGAKLTLGVSTDDSKKQVLEDEHSDVEMTTAPTRNIVEDGKSNKDDPTAMEYLNVMINFLTGFCENAQACVYLIQTGAMEFIWDLVTSPSLPYNFNSSSESLETVRLLHTLVNSKPHLVLPSLVIRVEDSIAKLRQFMEYDQPQSIFAAYLDTDTKDEPAIDGTATLKALIEVHTLSSILQESFGNVIPSSRNTYSLFAQVNLSDHWINIVEGLLKIQPACIWEEILLLKSVPVALKKSTFVEGLITDREEADRALGRGQVNDVSGSQANADVDAQSTDEPYSIKSENVTVLRYVLSQVPLTITPFLQSLARSLVAKRKYDHYVRQNIYKLAGTMVRCFMKQLDHKRVMDSKALRDRYAYFMVILTGFSRLIIDTSPERNYSQCMTLLLLMFKRQDDGLSKFNGILNTFYESIQNPSEDETDLLACAIGGMKIILNFYTQLVNAKQIVDSYQSQALQSSENEDKEGYYYFSPPQLLNDLRVGILSTIKPIWDSIDAEKASVASLKGMMDILRSIFETEHDNGVRKKSDGSPMMMTAEPRTYHVRSERLAALQARGASEDLAREACFRLLNSASGTEEYCDMHLRHMGVPRLPPPEGDIRRDMTSIAAITSASTARPASDTTISEPSNDSSPANERPSLSAPLPPTTLLGTEPPNTLATPLPTSTSMEVDTTSINQEDDDDDDDEENGMVLSIDNQLTLSEPPNEVPTQSNSRNSITPIVGSRTPLRSEKLQAPDVKTIDELNTVRQSIRKELVDKVLDVMSAHEGLTFDLADLLISATGKDLDADDMRKDVCTTLMQSLTSFMGSNLGTNGKKIADHSNLLAVILQDKQFYEAAGPELLEYFSTLVAFINIPTDEEQSMSSYPWISQLLLLMEKLLAEDVMPLIVSWTAPTVDSDGNYTLANDHEVKLKVQDPKISLEDRGNLLEAILSILPHVGKDASLGLSIVRVLVILTRSRQLADILGKKHNLQRLFLMVKQLAGIFDLDFQKTFVIILRHIIEDEDIIKEVMRADITALLTSPRSERRALDLTNYTKATAHLIIRAPELFISVTEELIKISSENSSRNGQYMLILKDSKTKESDTSTKSEEMTKPGNSPEEAKHSTEESADIVIMEEHAKIPESKVPVQEKADGVTHWLLSQLLQYKDVEDKDATQITTQAAKKSEEPSSIAAVSETSDAYDQPQVSSTVKGNAEKKSEKPEWVGEQHPHFHYRSFLLETLTELLESYQCAKLEFINFKQEHRVTTPSKPRPAMLNYLLTRLVPVGTLVKVDSITMKKKEAQSQWAISLIVALCLNSNHVDSNKVEENSGESDNDLTYIRKFVLESAYKAFKDVAAVDEGLDSKYGRLLNLADLFCRLLLGRPMPKNFYSSTSPAAVQKGIAKIMFEKNYIAMLTSAIADLDLNFPNSRRAVKYILRPLKLLTETAIELSQNAEIFVAPGTAEDDNISLATSVSDIDMDREETPDLFRNSTLGILEPGSNEDPSSESEDGEEEIYESGYEDEMDYDDEIDRDDDEVVSDEDEELDDAGPIEGLSGDHPMDVEVIIDNDDDDSDDDDSEDDDEDDDMDDDEELEIFEEISGDDDDPHGDGMGENEWEDEDEDEEDEDGDEDNDEPGQSLSQALSEDRNAITAIIGAQGAGREESTEPPELFTLGAARLGAHMRQMHQMDTIDASEQFDFGEMPPFNPAAMHDDDEDEEEEFDEDEDEDVEPNYEDEGDAPPWGWDEGDELGAVPPPRRHDHHWAGGRRNPWTMYPADDERSILPPGYRHHGRAGPDSAINAATHPLLQRSYSSVQRLLAQQRELQGHHADFMALLSRDRRSGSAMNLINSMIGAMGAGGVIDLAGPGGTLHVQIGGRDGAAILPFPNGDMMRFLGHPTGQSNSRGRASRHYDQTLIPRFMPGRTVGRWRFEAMMLCSGEDFVKRAQAITKAIEKVLVPASLEEAKIRLAEERKAIEEERSKREAETKAEEERVAKENAEKEAQEQREREEKEAADREAAIRAAENGETEVAQPDGSMEGIETAESTNTASEVQNEISAEPDQPRQIATFRGREVDISGLGIDLEYLDALPEELREEVLMQQLAEQRSQAAVTGQEGDEISPEFLAALPEDIRQELLAQEARDRRRREHAEARLQAQADGQAPRGEEMDAASFLASLDPGLRASVLVDQDDDMLDTLPPALQAEARALGADRARLYSAALVARAPHRIGIDRRHIQDTDEDPVVKKPKRQIVQMLDKSGVATLLRLLFVSQQGNGREILNEILRNISLNRQNRAEVIGLLLTVLQEGSMDAAAVEKSFAQLSIRAKQSASSQRTPLKRTNTSSVNSALLLDMSPATIIQQCLSTLVFLTRENIHVPSFFLTESEGFAKSKAVRKGKGKDTTASKFALNSLLTLLDRPIILDSAGCMEQLSTLLQHITHPLTILAKKDKKNSSFNEKESKPANTGEATTSNTTAPDQPANNDQPVQVPVSTTADASTDVHTDTSQVLVDIAKEGTPTVEEGPKKQRNLVPPVVPQENLRLVVSILAARECSAKTFRDTVSTISNLSAIPGAKETFGKELISQAQDLGRLISKELDELIPQVENAEDKTDAQGVPAMTKFAAPAADQAKLLRVLTALDYLFDPKRSANIEDSKAGSSDTAEEVLAGLYESAAFGPLWQKLSDCLTAMKDRNYILNVATILLPLIESLMVICKNTTIKDTSVKPAKEFSVASPEPESLVENLFFRFTEDHRKILNELVRHNPRLMSGTFSLLVKNPKVLEFDNKRNYFTRRLHSRGDQRRSQPPLNLPIRRDRTFLDSFQALYYKSPDEIKYGKLNIRFHGEEGVDAGGVTREWFQVMSRQMFDPNWALFIPVAADRTTFHPNKLSHINEPHLMWFKFIGRIIGKALYEGRALDCHFSRAVYKKILGKSVSVKDMETLDLEYYKSLVWMLENDITELIDQTFSVESEAFGVTEIVDLIPDGRNVAVTEENKQEYVQLIVEYRLIGSVKEQLEHFLKGFHDIVPAELINIFNEQELELLISGLPEIDVEDWKNNTDYHQYTISSPQIQWFWRAVRSFDKEERAKLLQFVTGTSKVPLNGFKELEGMNGFTRFNIHRDYGNKDRLPSSHTCFNQLDLPEYESYEILRQRLYTAITTGSDYFGFA